VVPAPHLGEEVVGVDVGRIDDLGQRRRFDRGDRLGIGRRGRPSDASGDAHPRGAQAAGQRRRRGPGGVGGEAMPREAGVEGEAGKGADVGAGRVAGVGDPAQAVEDAVVGVEAAGYLFDPRFADLPLEREQVRTQAAEVATVEGGGAQGRVAAADQVEAAVQDAVAVECAVGLDRGLDVGFRAHAGERGRGREQLHVRGQGPASTGRPGAQRPPGLAVDREQAAGASAAPREAGAQRRAIQPGGRLRGRRDEGEREETANRGNGCRGSPHLMG
jgi:hypothetical protein